MPPTVSRKIPLYDREKYIERWQDEKEREAKAIEKARNR